MGSSQHHYNTLPSPFSFEPCQIWPSAGFPSTSLYQHHLFFLLLSTAGSPEVIANKFQLNKPTKQSPPFPLSFLSSDALLWPVRPAIGQMLSSQQHLSNRRRQSRTPLLPPVMDSYAAFLLLSFFFHSSLIFSLNISTGYEIIWPDLGFWRCSSKNY